MVPSVFIHNLQLSNALLQVEGHCLTFLTNAPITNFVQHNLGRSVYGCNHSHPTDTEMLTFIQAVLDSVILNTHKIKTHFLPQILLPSLDHGRKHKHFRTSAALYGGNIIRVYIH
jgi:hypothetical protein